ncbi:hypothetical protein Tco_1072002, partial [Tanacetum coccineum]
EETFQVVLDIIKVSPCFKAFTITTDVPKIYMQQFWFTIKKSKKTPFYEFGLADKKYSVYVELFRKILDICLKVPNKDFVAPPSEEDLLAFLIEPGYKGPLDYLAKIMFYKKNVDYPELIWEDFTYQINYSQAKMRRREIIPYPRFTKIIINHFLSLNASIPKGPSSGLHIIKDDGVISRLNFVRIGEDFQECGLKISSTHKLTSPLLNTPKKSKDVALELRKSISLTEAEEEEAARRVHVTHERLVSESDEPFDKPTNRPTGRRRPSGIAFTDTSSVPDESISIFTASSKGTGIVLGVPYEVKGTFEAKADSAIDWEEKKQDDVDDDRSIDIEETDDDDDDDDDEKTEYEFVHGDEHVHDDVDEEMKDAKDVETRKYNKEITDQKRQMLKRQKYKYQFTVGHSNLTRVTPATTLPPPPFITNLTPILQQQSTPIPTPPISTTTPTTTIVLDPLPAIVPTVVDEYLGSSLGDTLQKILQKHTEELIQQSSQKDVFKIIKIKQEQAAKEKVPKFSATVTPLFSGQRSGT